MNDLLRRRAAVDATLAKFRDRPIDWQRIDCIRMARFHLIELGYSPPPLPCYRSALGARRALERAGGMEAIFDGLLERISPARMLLGDIVMLDGEGGGAAAICTGFKVAGWHQDSDVLVNITPLNVRGAWRV